MIPVNTPFKMMYKYSKLFAYQKRMKKKLNVKVRHHTDGLMDFVKTPEQELISKYMNDNIILNSFRQQGISTLIAHSILETLILDDGAVLYVGSTHRMSNYFWDMLVNMFQTLPKETTSQYRVSKDKIVHKRNPHSFILRDSLRGWATIFRGDVINNSIRVVIEHVQFAKPNEITQIGDNLTRLHERMSPNKKLTLQFFDSDEGILSEIGNQIYLNYIYGLANFHYISVNPLIGAEITKHDEFVKLIETLKRVYGKHIEYKGLKRFLHPVWYKIFNIL